MATGYSDRTRQLSAELNDDAYVANGFVLFYDDLDQGHWYYFLVTAAFMLSET